MTLTKQLGKIRLHMVHMVVQKGLLNKANHKCP